MRFSGVDKAAISERNDYGYGCILSVYEKGVPTIIKKYGKEIFEITDNYVKCKIRTPCSIWFVLKGVPSRISFLCKMSV